MAIKFSDLEMAHEYVSSDGGGGHAAFICRETGRIYWETDDPDLEEIPEDIDDDTKYASVPSKHDLDLGKPLVLDFARECLPNDFDEVRDIFSRSGAYRNFRALLQRRHALDRWHAFENKATESALREWCETEGLAIED
ncbi:MAG: hypothetical protein JOY90_22875 [Bradyrhizobium sp.]|uniref:hypothetical protein n=1 Tax=Bradyrhizobium sp. TaxID=376 RepID=UPI001DB05FDE|nr:hypothetical protein [Bradyrhizobium sp.]MBV9563261.1 hypothetical protein [Bradyrhizobium sp.]